MEGKQDDTEISASSDDTELKREYPSGLAVTLILTSVTLAYFLFFLDLAVISTATPAITTQFDSLVDVGWYVHTHLSVQDTAAGRFFLFARP